MTKRDTTTPAVPAPKVTPNPGQIFEEPTEPQGETTTASSEPTEAPAQPES